MDMVQLLFSRLPQFKEDPKWLATMKKLKMRTGGVDPSRIGRKKRSPKVRKKISRGTTPTSAESSSSAEVVPTIKETDEDKALARGLEYLNTPVTRLSTTPGTPGDGTTYNISEEFQAASERERQAHDMSESQEDLTKESLEPPVDETCEKGELSAASSSADLTASSVVICTNADDDIEKVSLHIM